MPVFDCTYVNLLGTHSVGYNSKEKELLSRKMPARKRIWKEGGSGLGMALPEWDGQRQRGRGAETERQPKAQTQTLEVGLPFFGHWRRRHVKSSQEKKRKEKRKKGKEHKKVFLSFWHS